MTENSKPCRLCLHKSSNEIDIFKDSEKETLLKSMIYQLFSFWIKPSDVFTHVCLQCIRLVKQFHKFYIQVKDTQSRLLDVEKANNKTTLVGSLLKERSAFEHFNDNSFSGKDLDEKKYSDTDCIKLKELNNETNISVMPAATIKIENDDKCDSSSTIEYANVYEPSILNTSTKSKKLRIQKDKNKTNNFNTADVFLPYENNINNGSDICKIESINDEDETSNTLLHLSNKESFHVDLHLQDYHIEEKVKHKNGVDISRKKSLSLKLSKKRTKKICLRKFEENDACDLSDDQKVCELKPIESSKVSQFPSELVKNGKFIMKRSIIEGYASNFFNIQCPICRGTREFHKLSEMLRHYVAEHNGRGYVVCCDTRLYRRDIIYMHMTRHLQPSAFECPICKKKVTRFSALKPHLETHLPEAERSYKCDQCGRSYTNNSGLSYHKLTHIPVDQRSTHDCEICGKGFLSASSCSTHVAVVHSSPRYLCSECGRSFHVRHSYVEHLQIHDPSGKNRVKCHTCGFVCKNKVTLKFHMKTHNLERFNCGECDFSSHRRTFLNQHKQVRHSDSKPHVCLICGKQFKRKNILNNHMAQHTGERKYACSFCPKTFASSGNCYTHRRRMHAEQHKNDMDLKQKERFTILTEVQTEPCKEDAVEVQELARQEIKQLISKKCK